MPAATVEAGTGPGRPSAAHTPLAQPGHEARRKGRRRAWDWHSGSLDWGTHPHARTPPITAANLCSTKGCRRSGGPRATYQQSRVPPAPRCRRPQTRSQGRERRGAAAPRCGQRPPAKPAGYPLLSHRARRQLRPGVVPPPPPPPPAFPPPPSLRLRRRGR